MAGDSSASAADDFLVVGLGASAGGIQALKEFFSKVPQDSGIAYVVILHMSPEHESKLAEVLQLTSLIPVTQVRERIRVMPNQVYVIPPNQNLTMNDGHLALTDMIGVEERRSPVDLFFRTLAESNGPRAVSVILSGTGSNGSIGLKRIKEHGGVAFVQAPDEAQYTDMPCNAIATGLVDYILPVRDIPGKILSYKVHRRSIQLVEPQAIETTHEEALREIFTHLRVRTGHDFSNYKRATMLRRIERRLGIKELSGLPEYAQYLRDNQDESVALLKDLLISVTNFFRDPQSIEALAEKVLPAIIAKKSDDAQVRVWVPGCATGEEAYSIAMLLNEALTASANWPKLQLFASDLDSEAIVTARDGFYSDAEVADISPERLRRFFSKEPGGYRVVRELREMILFAVHNVIKDPPFSHLDLISCRNLLIYLNRNAQNRVLEVMHFALNSGGYLFLGASESIDGSIDLFSIVDKEHHIFQSRPVPPRAVFPLPDLIVRRPLVLPSEKERTLQETRAIERLSYVELHQRLLEEFAPPSLIINEEYEILHLSDNVGLYLHIGGGEPTKNLLKLIRPELRLDLRTSLYEATHNHTEVETSPLPFQTDQGVAVSVKITVRPIFREDDPIRGFILVLFEQVVSTEVPANADTSIKPLARLLEDELMHLKSQLESTVEQHEIQQEELRASNEELQVTNEELRSSAEELETSKEELQSLNEELITVNQELKTKIEELSQANNDFANLMNSTDIGTIFLDRMMKVKLFTPRARDVFNLIPTDIGRPLLDITNKLTDESLAEDIEHVVRTLNKTEKEVASLEGRSYAMRILPYRTTEDRIDGVVITLLDITERATTKSQLESARTEVSERRQSDRARLKLLNQLVSSQERERRRVARDLHDQLGQQLTTLRLKLENLKATADKRQKLAAFVDEVLEIVTQLDSDVDFLAWELRPVVLDDLGLDEALQLYVDRWQEHVGISAEFHGSGFKEQRLPSEVENNLYRITQEALNNAAKHSGATRVGVILERRDHQAVLIVEDNGVGFRPETQLESTSGLSGMRERAVLIGADFQIESIHEKGTTIFVRVPLASESGAI